MSTSLIDGLSHKDCWKGEHRGLNFEVVHWGKSKDEQGINEGDGMWNYYILINQEQLTPEEFKKVWLRVKRWFERSSGRKQPCHDYYNSILSHGDFHGGITHYSKHQCPDEKYRYIKVGCDYGHLWDMEAGYPYDLAWVAQDAKVTIDKLHEVLRFKQRCYYMGTYHYPEEMIALETGTLISPEGNEKRKAA
jgi:hypothetical protein